MYTKNCDVISDVKSSLHVVLKSKIKIKVIKQVNKNQFEKLYISTSKL